MSNPRLLLLPLLASFFAIPTASAAPTDACVRQAQAVPGAAVKHPQWWNPALSASQREVRWTGASVRTDTQSSAPELARSRMIWDAPSQTVFFEMEVNGDPTIDSTQDIVMLSVANSAGTAPELFMQFQPLRGCSPLSNCTGLGSAMASTAIQYSGASGSGLGITWTPMSSTNPNPSFVVEHPWVQVREVTSGGSTTYDWTLKFALRVPVDGSGQVRPNLRIYGNAVMYVPGAFGPGTAFEFPLLCNPSPGFTNDCLMFNGPSGALTDALPIGNMAANWPVLESANPSTCGGVEVIRQLVGSNYNPTTGVVPGTAVPYELPGFQIPNVAGARFRAGFHNDTAQAIPAGSVTAEFRIADWGLQYSDWNNATWSLVATAELNAPVSAGGYAGAFGEGRLESAVWVPSTSGLALENDHQCVHVRLQSSSAVDFKVDSVYRNMDIINASVARRPAVIDLGDRPLPKGKKEHDVYLLVHSEHMPDPGACKKTKGKLYGCAKGGKLIAERRALTSKQKQALSRDFEQGRVKLSKDEVQALMKQKAVKGKKPEELPYYVVHGMVDTGNRINLPGAPQTPVLVSFSEYGYYVQHEGEPVEGWESFVHGADPVAGADNLFKIAVKPKTLVSVANTVRVLSKETKACKTPPKARWAVYNGRKVEELEAKIQAEVGKGSLADVGKVRVTDDQLGCDPPPLRLPCKAGKCGELSPAAYIEGNRFVGDWSVVERRIKKPGVRAPGTRRPGVRPGAKPAGKAPAGKAPGAKPMGKAPGAKPAPRGK